jgi:glycosyltransferase involved in cell wall biosynthesis
VRVLSVAYPFAPAGPQAVGGAEQVLAALDAGVVAAGGRSLVLACPGSSVRGTLHLLPPVPSCIDEAARRQAWAQARAEVARLAAHVDVVHLHGLDFPRYLPPAGVPTVATLHLPLSFYEEDLLALAGVRLVCVSRAQRARGGPRWANVPVVENGVSLEGRPARKRAFALALGRICPEKGLHDAVDAARHAGLSLGIAGAVFPYEAHQAYLRDVLAPRLDRRRRLIGAVSGRRKQRLLASAQCLVVSSIVEETSSLVAMEALAAGTPVVARRVGALPEIVEDGRTGFLVDSVAEMGEALARSRELSPDDCRRASRRFDAAAMVTRYLELYSSYKWLCNSTAA